MKWRCIFNGCSWRHVTDILPRFGRAFGLYQCTRCKTMFVGATREEQKL